MKACEIFQSLSSALAREIVAYLRTEQKDIYRATVATLAQQRKLRPQFVQKKTGEQQILWILETLRLRSSEVVGEQLLQVWLMKTQSPMLVQFLDALGIAHDGKGGVDGEIPPDFDVTMIESAVSGLLEKFPAESVAVYLHIFQLQQPGGWSAIAGVLAAEPRLALGGGAQVAA
jgi:hypothetical protein